ncbi:MAG TPA: hypothetical protein VEX43_17370 [Chthoniobacterales bacterium]|nr:hypothetical protein [Chthoniobacterales bacterium]
MLESAHDSCTVDPLSAMSEYFDPETGAEYNATEFAELGPAHQKRIIKHWFRQRYENPAENTPYESAEGGYIYIWGGPHDAEEILWSEFGQCVPENFIEAVAQELESEEGTTEWASVPGREDFDLDYSASEFFQRFEASIDTLRRLAALHVGATEKPALLTLLALLYANAVTVLEAYLSDVFISLINKYPSLFRKFVESEPSFKERSLSVSQLFQHLDKVHEIVSEHLSVFPFHRLEKVRKMYATVLGVEFPRGIGDIFKAILIRHDLVHRNGFTKDGKTISITADAVAELTRAVETLIEALDAQIRTLIDTWESPPPPDIPLS